MRGRAGGGSGGVGVVVAVVGRVGLSVGIGVFGGEAAQKGRAQAEAWHSGGYTTNTTTSSSTLVRIPYERRSSSGGDGFNHAARLRCCFGAVSAIGPCRPSSHARMAGRIVDVVVGHVQGIVECLLQRRTRIQHRQRSTTTPQLACASCLGSACSPTPKTVQTHLLPVQQKAILPIVDAHVRVPQETARDNRDCLSPIAPLLPFTSLYYYCNNTQISKLKLGFPGYTTAEPHLFFNFIHSHLLHFLNK